MPIRIVFFGDTITDGSHFPILVRQSLQASDKAAPVCINCGSSADLTQDLAERLDLVLQEFEPDLVVIGAGVSDIRNEVPLDAFGDHVGHMLQHVREAGVDGIVMTMPKLSQADTPEVAEAQPDYNMILRQLTRSFKMPLAEVYQLMDNIDDRTELLAEDRIHPNFDGTRVIARAILDAMGFPDVPVLKKLTASLLPGVIPKWWVKEMPSPEETVTMSADEVTEICNHAKWSPLCLPQSVEQNSFYRKVIRQQGFAVDLKDVAGDSGHYLACSQVSSKTQRDAFINTGGLVQGVWLNGERVYRSQGIRAYHAGRDRIRVSLKEGENQLVVMSGPDFFLSITEGPLWN